MYDTVVLKLLKEDIGDKYDWRSVFNKIDQTSEYKQVEGGSGHINGLRVSVTEKHVRVTGSLSKYFRGTNLDSLTLSQVEKAIKQLGKELGVPMIEADVERVDMAENFEMSRPPNFIFLKCKVWGNVALISGKGLPIFLLMGYCYVSMISPKKCVRKGKIRRILPVLSLQVWNRIY